MNTLDYIIPSESIAESIAVFKRAKQVIIERGWCQGMPGRTGPVCVQRAIGIAKRDLGLASFLEVDGAIQDLMKEFTGYLILPKWNDQPGRTKEEALALLDKGIAKLLRSMEKQP